eukprot:m.336830 g.336830  ORF g.336830 m.336830 type:complete len:310 (-) comp17970_c0_seq1:81-1010(-)
MADDKEEKPKVPDATARDKIPEWKPKIEATGTLSRNHAKMKQKFDEKQRQTDEDSRILQAALQHSKRPSASLERTDSRWRADDPGKFVVQPFAFLRLTHDAIRLSMEEILNKSKKLGSSPIAITMLKTTLGSLKVCFQTHRLVEEEGGFFDLLEKLGGKPVKSDLIELNTSALSDIEKVEASLDKASKGDHSGVTEAQQQIPELGSSFEMYLRAKEEVMMPLSPKMSDAKTISPFLDPVRKMQGKLAKHAEFIAKLLATKRPFSNVRMFVASLQSITKKDEFDAMRTGLEKSCNATDSTYWAKIQEFLA